MSIEEILKVFEEINRYYNDCTRYDTLERMLNELLEDIEADIIECSFISDIYNDRTDDEIVMVDKVLKIIGKHIRK